MYWRKGKSVHDKVEKDIHFSTLLQGIAVHNIMKQQYSDKRLSERTQSSQFPNFPINIPHKIIPLWTVWDTFWLKANFEGRSFDILTLITEFWLFTRVLNMLSLNYAIFKSYTW